MPGVWDTMGAFGGDMAGAFGGAGAKDAFNQQFNDFRGGARDVWAHIAGDANHPGIFGTGQYHTDTPTVDPGAAAIPGAAQMQQQAQQGAVDAAGRSAPNMTAAQINTGPQDQFRGQQAYLAQQLADQSMGRGPSVAQTQLRQGTDRNLAQAYALASATPQNAGTAREIANQRSMISQQGASDSATLALQEQLQARNQLGQVLAGARGQDIGVASDQAQLQQQAGAANQGAQLQQSALNDQMVRYYLGMGMSLAEAQQQAQMQIQQLQIQAQLGAAGINAGAYSSAAGANGRLAGGVLSGIGSAFAAGATGGASTALNAAASGLKNPY
jgi:hypothetical protein